METVVKVERATVVKIAVFFTALFIFLYVGYCAIQRTDNP